MSLADDSCIYLRPFYALDDDLCVLKYLFGWWLALVNAETLDACPTTHRPRAPEAHALGCGPGHKVDQARADREAVDAGASEVVRGQTWKSLPVPTGHIQIINSIGCDKLPVRQVLSRHHRVE